MTKIDPKWRVFQYPRWMRNVMQILTISQMVKEIPISQSCLQKYIPCPDCQKSLVECRCGGGG